MEVRNCLRCGEVYRPIAGRRICAACVEADRQEYQSVREYLRRRPKSTMLEVSDATGVSIKKLQEYVREGRLVTTGDDWGIQCEQCGAPVSKGRLCQACTAKLEKELRESVSRTRVSNFGERRLSSGNKVIRDRFRRR